MVSRKTGELSETSIDVEAASLADMLRSPAQEKKRVTLRVKHSRDSSEEYHDAAQDVLFRGSSFLADIAPGSMCVEQVNRIPPEQQRHQPQHLLLKPRNIFASPTQVTLR